MIVRIPVIGPFLAPNALFHLGINLTTGQKPRNRVKRTKTGRQSLTPHPPHPPPCCRPPDRHSGNQRPRQRTFVLSSFLNSLFSRKPELPRGFSGPVALSEGVSPASKFFDRSLGLKTRQFPGNSQSDLEVGEKSRVGNPENHLFHPCCASG